MDNIHSIGYSSLEHIRYLADEIGPRPAGSEAEKLALDYAGEQLARYGYQPQWMDVPFAEPPKIEAGYLLAGLALAFCGLFWPFLPWISLLAPLILVLVPELEKINRRNVKKEQKSQNVSAVLEGKAEDPLVIFCAHVDTARGMTLDHPWWVIIYAKGMSIMQRLAILIALLSIVNLIGFQIPQPATQAIQLIVIIVGLVFMVAEVINQCFKGKDYSTGAIDNASGVGLVLALAEYFAEFNPKRMQMAFLITGAEEPGLYGAEAFAGQLNTKRKTLIVNLDMVGAGGQLQVVTKVGSLFTLGTCQVVNQLLFEILPQARGVWYSLKSGDFEPFLRMGFDAISIQMAGNGAAETGYHTIRDKTDLVDIQSLETTASVMVQLIETLPYSDWAIHK